MSSDEDSDDCIRPRSTRRTRFDPTCERLIKIFRADIPFSYRTEDGERYVVLTSSPKKTHKTPGGLGDSGDGSSQHQVLQSGAADIMMQRCMEIWDKLSRGDVGVLPSYSVFVQYHNVVVTLGPRPVVLRYDKITYIVPTEKSVAAKLNKVRSSSSKSRRQMFKPTSMSLITNLKSMFMYLEDQREKRNYIKLLHRYFICSTTQFVYCWECIGQRSLLDKNEQQLDALARWLRLSDSQDLYILPFLSLMEDSHKAEHLMGLADVDENRLRYIVERGNSELPRTGKRRGSRAGRSAKRSRSSQDLDAIEDAAADDDEETESSADPNEQCDATEEPTTATGASTSETTGRRRFIDVHDDILLRDEIIKRRNNGHTAFRYPDDIARDNARLYIEDIQLVMRLDIADNGSPMGCLRTDFETVSRFISNFLSSDPRVHKPTESGSAPCRAFRDAIGSAVRPTRDILLVAASGYSDARLLNRLIMGEGAADDRNDLVSGRILFLCPDRSTRDLYNAACASDHYFLVSQRYGTIENIERMHARRRAYHRVFILDAHRWTERALLGVLNDLSACDAGTPIRLSPDIAGHQIVLMGDRRDVPPYGRDIGPGRPFVDMCSSRLFPLLYLDNTQGDEYDFDTQNVGRLLLMNRIRFSGSARSSETDEEWYEDNRCQLEDRRTGYIQLISIKTCLRLVEDLWSSKKSVLVYCDDIKTRKSLVWARTGSRNNQPEFRVGDVVKRLRCCDPNLYVIEQFLDDGRPSVLDTRGDMPPHFVPIANAGYTPFNNPNTVNGVYVRLAPLRHVQTQKYGEDEFVTVRLDFDLEHACVLDWTMLHYVKWHNVGVMIVDDKTTANTLYQVARRVKNVLHIAVVGSSASTTTTEGLICDILKRPPHGRTTIFKGMLNGICDSTS